MIRLSRAVLVLPLAGVACCCFGASGTGLAGHWVDNDHSSPPTSIDSRLVLEGNDASGTFELHRVVTNPPDVQVPGCRVNAEIRGQYTVTSARLTLAYTSASYDSVGCSRPGGPGWSPPATSDEASVLAPFNGPMTVSASELRCGSMVLERSF